MGRLSGGAIGSNQLSGVGRRSQRTVDTSKFLIAALRFAHLNAAQMALVPFESFLFLDTRNFVGDKSRDKHLKKQAATKAAGEAEYKGHPVATKTRDGNSLKFRHRFSHGKILIIENKDNELDMRSGCTFEVPGLPESGQILRRQSPAPGPAQGQ
jgi:hypothetical protein